MVIVTFFDVVLKGAQATNDPSNRGTRDNKGKRNGRRTSVVASSYPHCPLSNSIHTLIHKRPSLSFLSPPLFFLLNHVDRDPHVIDDEFHYNNDNDDITKAVSASPPLWIITETCGTLWVSS